jgi:hypothetical protein
LDYTPHHIFKLKNKNILVGSWDDKLFALYDSEFKLIRKIREIDHQIQMPPNILVSDQAGNLYLTNEYDGTLCKVDSELNLIKSIDFIYNWPDITIHKNKIYACGDKFVRVYSLDLDMVSDHYFEDMPVRIRITADRACIQFRRKTDKDASTWITRFYKLPSFELVIEHDLAGPILAHDASFYLYHENDTGFTLFDKNGKIVKKIEKFFGKTMHCNSGMSFFNNALYICLTDGKRICKIAH